jgi:hypothetical protein
MEDLRKHFSIKKKRLKRTKKISFKKLENLTIFDSDPAYLFNKDKKPYKLKIKKIKKSAKIRKILKLACKDLGEIYLPF